MNTIWKGLWRSGKFGTYCSDGAHSSWVKIKNPTYSQAESRHELFEKRNGGMRRSGKGKRELVLA